MEYPINIYRRPRLRNPILIAGWTDAGLVGFNAVNYMIDKLGAKEFGDIAPPDYFSFPHSVIEGGVLKGLEYPGCIFHYWKNKKTREDLILFNSKPPDVNQYEFANLVMEVAEHFEVERIYTMGGIYADVPHTEAPRVFAVINNSGLKESLREHNIEAGPNYHGPTSMNGLLIGIAMHRNIEGISLWGTVPRYIVDVPDLQTSAALVEKLAMLLGIDIDMTDIQKDAEHAYTEIDTLITFARAQNPQLNDYMEKLEKHVAFEAPVEDSGRFIAEIEDFLKKQKKPGKDDPNDN